MPLLEAPPRGIGPARAPQRINAPDQCERTAGDFIRWRGGDASGARGTGSGDRAPRAALSSRGRAHRCSWRRRRGPRRVSGPEVVADAWISLFPGWCRSMSTVSAIWRVALEARSELGLL